MRFSRRGVVIGLLIALLGGGAIFGTLKLLGSEEVLYLAADAPGPIPFTDPAVFASANQRIAQVTTTIVPDASVPDPAGSFSPVLPAVPAPEPEIKAEPGTCDQEKLIDLLEASPERQAAWAEVLNVEVENTQTYIRGLTPAELTRDTRVSYFGFKDGKAEELQAILASETAVLVASSGDVVLRCYSGTPTKPPRKIKYNCEGCPDNFEPPPACSGTCYEAATTTLTTLPPTTTTLLETTTTTAAAARTKAPRKPSGATTTRRAGATTTRRSGATTTTTRVPPVNQTTGTLFPPNTGTFAPPAPPGPSSTAVTSVPTTGGGATTTTSNPTTTTACLGVPPLCLGGAN